jgi:hypothetical protein
MVGAILVVLLALALSACGGSSSPSSSVASSSSKGATTGSSATAGGDFKVLYIGPLSGATAIAGKAEVAGIKAAAAVINGQGGILNHHVTVTVMDDGGLGTTAVSQGQQVLSSATAVSATSQVQSALSAHPQAITFAGFTPPIPAIIKAVYELDPKMHIYEDPFASSFPLAAATTAAERKLITSEDLPFIIRGNAAQQQPAWITFHKSDAVFDPNPPLNLIADLDSYNSLMMARAAAVKAGTITGVAVPNALGHIYDSSSVPGFVGGKYLYTPSDHYWAVQPGDYTFSPGGTFDKGLLAPGT